jgi:glycosyltransferase involved in cell wall biosynthesis
MRHLITQKPLISVILPVYNADKYLVEALESLRYQTYPHFEVIAIDDASTDLSYKILKNYAKLDSRFHVFKNKENLKIANSLNFGLTKAKGHFIARMDADDISLPNRFQKQIKYLLSHPGVVVVGGQCLTIDKDSHITGKKLFPTNHIAIHELMYTSNPLQHPSIMINRSLLPKGFSWYNPHLTPAEDLDLYFRLGKFGLYANLHSAVLMYRQHKDSETFKNPKYTFKITKKVRRLALSKYGYKPNLKSLILASLQSLALSILPSSLIFPVYRFIRGTRIEETIDNISLRLASN